MACCAMNFVGYHIVNVWKTRQSDLGDDRASSELFSSPNNRDLAYDMFDVFTHDLCDGAGCLRRFSCDHQMA